jgi:hypothetical protein
MKKREQDIRANVIVYQHRRISDGEIFYIGIGAKNRPYSKLGRNNHWVSYTNKYDYVVDILLKDLTWEEACTKEKSLILEYGRRDLKQGTLVNKTDGGEGAYGVIKQLSQETKNKIGEKSRGRKPSLQTKLKMAESARGRICSDETKRKISESNRGKTISQEHKKAISNAHKGKKSPHISERNRLNKGRDAWNKGLVGRVMSEETKSKIRESLQRTRLKNKLK